jgi:preprotein translocase SecE subunit
VARNRKRAKERRARRPREAAFGRPGVATARAGESARDAGEATPDPIEHAAPDVELADAQLAVGRPELEDGEDFSAEAEAEELEEEIADGRRGGGAAVLTTVAEPRLSLVPRLVGFLQGSWRELQRVQWPDRRQVAQATGVVIGFVIVAGVFLGLSDLVAQKLITFIINGK